LVVRFKGGDVSIYSKIHDELETIVSPGIEYEIIPGITAASGASAYGGIPLTARGYSTAVRFLTFYKSTIVPDDYWQQLASTDDTLVFYMSSETLVHVADKLTTNKINEDKLLAVIEQATTPFQKITVYNLYKEKEELRSRTFISPSLVIIGRVVGLHEQFKWQENLITDEYYFKPILNTIPAKKSKSNKHVSAI
jgi:uroporphyrin-III C-methyltransferase/precorrin-2 dehydrogenase/sirohydrochlorin ferrochelatase/uroporphyrin-III C-methyltransferase